PARLSGCLPEPRRRKHGWAGSRITAGSTASAADSPRRSPGSAIRTIAQATTLSATTSDDTTDDIARADGTSGGARRGAAARPRLLAEYEPADSITRAAVQWPRA